VVTDDGEGAGGEGVASGGFGLRALRERVEILGGTTTWGDSPEGGFALVVELPIRSSQAVRP
jgi:signal transduction histidine kinase